MRKTSKIIFVAAIVAIAAVVLFVFNANSDGPIHSAITTGERGVSLLYDTLRHMGYPARISRRPLTASTNTNYVYIIIQPVSPPFDDTKMQALFDWAYAGGRLVFLHNSFFNFMGQLSPEYSTQVGNLTVHSIGSGEIVVGRAQHITNLNMMNDHETGTALHSILSRWGAERIFFAEYYHGLHNPGNFFTNLPLIVRLVFVQLILVSIIVVWHIGKRFGNAIPYYQEVEREENEHVRALARLYMKIKNWR